MAETISIRRAVSVGIELRLMHSGRRFTEVAVVDPRVGRDPLRTEVVMNNKLQTFYCRACKSADGAVASVCRHIKAARRFMARRHLTVLE